MMSDDDPQGGGVIFTHRDRDTTLAHVIQLGEADPHLEAAVLGQCPGCTSSGRGVSWTPASWRRDSVYFLDPIQKSTATATL
jgi:hypothetical protein